MLGLKILIAALTFSISSILIMGSVCVCLHIYSELKSELKKIMLKNK